MTEKEKRALIIKISEASIGIKESPPNSNNVIFNTRFYGKEVSGSAYPWCATFVSEVFQEAKLFLGIIGYSRGFAGTQYALANIGKWGKIVPKEEAQPGDIVFFDWNVDKKPDHVGIVKEINLTANKINFVTIEGNTSLGNNSDGGEVMKRQRQFSHSTFVKPNVYNS